LRGLLITWYQCNICRLWTAFHRARQKLIKNRSTFEPACTLLLPAVIISARAHMFPWFWRCQWAERLGICRGRRLTIALGRPRSKGHGVRSWRATSWRPGPGRRDASSAAALWIEKCLRRFVDVVRRCRTRLRVINHRRLHLQPQWRHRHQSWRELSPLHNLLETPRQNRRVTSRYSAVPLDKGHFSAAATSVWAVTYRAAEWLKCQRLLCPRP